MCSNCETWLKQTRLTLSNDSVQDVHQLCWTHFHVLHGKSGNMIKPQRWTKCLMNGGWGDGGVRRRWQGNLLPQQAVWRLGGTASPRRSHAALRTQPVCAGEASTRQNKARVSRTVEVRQLLITGSNTHRISWKKLGWVDAAAKGKRERKKSCKKKSQHKPPSTLYEMLCFTWQHWWCLLVVPSTFSFHCEWKINEEEGAVTTEEISQSSLLLLTVIVNVSNSLKSNHVFLLMDE